MKGLQRERVIMQQQKKEERKGKKWISNGMQTENGFPLVRGGIVPKNLVRGGKVSPSYS